MSTGQGKNRPESAVYEHFEPIFNVPVCQLMILQQFLRDKEGQIEMECEILCVVTGYLKKRMPQEAIWRIGEWSRTG